VFKVFFDNKKKIIQKKQDKNENVSGCIVSTSFFFISADLENLLCKKWMKIFMVAPLKLFLNEIKDDVHVQDIFEASKYYKSWTYLKV
jgi:hypothetical protein